MGQLYIFLYCIFINKLFIFEGILFFTYFYYIAV